MPKLSLQQDITQTPTIGNMLWELSEINNLVEVAGLLHLLDPLKVFGLWLETTKLTSLNKCWLIVLKEIVMVDGPMMVLIPLSGKEEIALKLIIPTMPPMVCIFSGKLENGNWVFPTTSSYSYGRVVGRTSSGFSDS